MKRMIVIVLILLIFGFIRAAYAGEGAVLPELIRPFEIHVDGQQMYVVEGIKIFIYSLKDFNLVTSFGKQGEGPREFLPRGPNPVSLILQEQQIIVQSLGKLTYFKRDGQYIEEIKMNPRSGREHQPFKGIYVARFVTRQDDGRLFHGIAFYDKDFNKLKEIYRHEHGFPLYRKFEFNPLTIEQPSFKILGSRIFVLDGGGSVVNIYDESGQLKASLKNKKELEPFTKQDKSALIESYQRDNFFRRFYQKYKRLYKFPDYYPPILWFYIDRVNKDVYLSTYKNKDGKRVYLVYTMTGQFVKRVELPANGESWLTAVFDKKLYRLIENEDEEEWRLDITEIK